MPVAPMPANRASLFACYRPMLGDKPVKGICVKRHAASCNPIASTRVCRINMNWTPDKYTQLAKPTVKPVQRWLNFWFQHVSKPSRTPSSWQQTPRTLFLRRGQLCHVPWLPWRYFKVLNFFAGSGHSSSDVHTTNAALLFGVLGI